MPTARRLYLYGVSAAALALLIGGADNLLRVLLVKLGVGTGSTVLAGVAGDPDRESVSLGLALVAVGLPLWLIHWALVERGARRAGEAGASERRSIVRAAFFAVAPFSLLLTAAWSTVSVLDWTLRDALVPTPAISIIDGYGYRPDLSGPLAWAILGWAFWAYHAFVRSLDVRSGALQRWSASLARLYLYGAAFTAAVIALQAASSAMHAVWLQTGYSSSLVDVPLSYGYADPSRAATQLLVSSLVTTGVWAAVWAAHLWYASARFVAAEPETAPAATSPERVTASGMPEPRPEGLSRLRFVYFTAFALVGAIAVAAAIVGAAQILLGSAFGGGGLGGSGRFQAFMDAIVIGVPYAVAWWLHLRRARHEWAAVPPASPNPSRAAAYLVALVGVAFVGYGIGNAVYLTLERAIGAATVAGLAESGWKYQMAVATAQGVAGLAIWLWPWLSARRRLAERRDEAVSTARRWYLWLVSGASLLAAVIGAAALIYQVARVALGVASFGFGTPVSAPLAAVIVGGALFAAHGLALRRDLAAGEHPEAAPEREAAAAAAAVERLLVIVGPPGADLDAVRAAIEPQLPEGYSLEVRSATT